VGVRAGSFFLDLLLPQRCSACGMGESVLCERCLAGLHRLEGPLCARCGAPTAWPVARCAECTGRPLAFASARAAVAYEGPAPALVAAWKERGLRALAEACAELVAATVPVPPVAALTFVPGEPERVLWRGHNAGEALARLMGECWSLPVLPLLERTRRVPRQRGLSRSRRRANVRGAFRSRATPPRTVALVEDVYTTGATAGAAATELRRAGAHAVHVVAFARAVRR
jgi:predicted amidophosphoribosyltransferase